MDIIDIRLSNTLNINLQFISKLSFKANNITKMNAFFDDKQEYKTYFKGHRDNLSDNNDQIDDKIGYIPIRINECFIGLGYKYKRFLYYVCVCSAWCNVHTSHHDFVSRTGNENIIGFLLNKEIQEHFGYDVLIILTSKTTY